MTVLVTGATGFLGSHVVAALLEEGADVRALVRSGSTRSFLAERGVAMVEGDLHDDHSLRQACRGVERLVHCAARKGYWSKQNHEQRHVNVEGTARLFRAAHDHRSRAHRARVVDLGRRVHARCDGGRRDGYLEWPRAAHQLRADQARVRRTRARGGVGRHASRRRQSGDDSRAARQR